MASEVDICNLGLARLGDPATVASINPPEGSAQAGHCKRWYPITRDLLLEAHPWGFATQRVSLADLGSAWPSWAYAYELPSDCIKAWAVLPEDAPSDYGVSLPPESQTFVPTPADYMTGAAVYTPQDFEIETDSSGNRLLYCNEPNAVLRYTRQVTDPTRFSPAFIDALGWLMASYLAGPLIKGDAGAQVAQTMYKFFMGSLQRATTSDSNNRQVRIQQAVPWISRR